VETTGLAVQALLKWGQAPGTAGNALRYIASKTDASGATIELEHSEHRGIFRTRGQCEARDPKSV
jgi:hypothetical protein